MLVDDHKMIIYGLKLVLKSRTLSFLEAGDFDSAVALLKEEKPEMAIIDYRIGHRTGDELVREIRYHSPHTRILAYSHVTDEEAVLRMADAGAHGFLLKSEPEEELLKAVDELLMGNVYFDMLSRSYLMNRLLSANDGPKGIHIGATFFADKEIELIRLLAQEMSAKQISARIFLSERTVEQYKSNIARKMGVHNTVGILIYSLKHGLLRHQEL